MLLLCCDALFFLLPCSKVLCLPAKCLPGPQQHRLACQLRWSCVRRYLHSTLLSKCNRQHMDCSLR
jgi:hypothetical protein